MSNRERLFAALPSLKRHEGSWTGTYRFVDLDGRVVDEYASRIECEFPDEGPYVYVQKNRYRWADDRELRYEFGGELIDGRLWWDTERFSGWGWETPENIFMLSLQRKDEPGVSFTEIILFAPDDDYRARTWHWFRDGRLFQRTLCDERRLR